MSTLDSLDASTLLLNITLNPQLPRTRNRRI